MGKQEDYSEYFDEQGKPRRGLPLKKPGFFRRLLAAIRRLIESIAASLSGSD